jgi:hypothetical protein
LFHGDFHSHNSGGDVWIIYNMQPYDAANNTTGGAVGQHDSPPYDGTQLVVQWGFWFQYDPFFFPLIDHWFINNHC